MAQYIFTMNGLGKVVPPKKEILKDINLNFFPGAKIGVLGYNGAGKSTLLRIMAGVDTDFIGEARPASGIRIGYLPQEPDLDPNKDVRGNVEDGLSDIKQAHEQLEAVYAAYAEPDADFDALATEQARLENIIQAADAHNLDRKLEVAADALRLPPWDAGVANLSGGERRRVALCRLLLSSPDMLILDEPTNHLDAESVAWLERFLKDYPGTVVAVTHDRYFLDNVAGWILELDRGHLIGAMAFPGKATIPPGWSRKRSGSRLKKEKKPPVKKPSKQSSTGYVQIQKHARPKARRACSVLKNCHRQNIKSAAKPTLCISRPAPGLATRWLKLIMYESNTAINCFTKT